MVTFNLHFSSGDPIWFAMWQPTSNGAVVGACSGVILLAIFERLVSCMRGVLEVEWKRRSLKLETEALRKRDIVHVSEKNSPEIITPPGPPSRQKPHSAEFVLSHDLGRGAMRLAEATLSYLLLLTVWTRNAWYIVSVIIGQGIGQMLFGRFELPASLLA